VARGEAIFNPFYAFDSYSFDFQRISFQSYFPLSVYQGRYGAGLLTLVLDAFGLAGMSAAVSTLISSAMLFCLTGLLCAIVIFRQLSAAEMILFLGLFTLHPFLTEYYTFAIATFHTAISYFLAAVALFASTTIRRPVIAIAIGTTLLTIATTIYQLAFPLALITWLFSIIVHVRNRGFTYSIDTGWIRTFLTIIAAGLCYFVLIKILTPLLGPMDGRADLSALLDIGAKLEMLQSALQLAIWPMPSLVPRIASISLILLMLLSSYAILSTLPNRHPFLVALTFILCTSTALALSVGASAVGRVVWLVPRVLFLFAIFAAALATLGWHYSSPLSRKIQSVLVLCICLAYIGSSNRIIYDQRRTNLWDFQQTNRMIARLEEQPTFKTVQSIAIVGTIGRTVPTQIGDMNVSALNVDDAKAGLVEQATGYYFRSPNASEWKRAREQCGTMEKWPALKSVTILDDLAIICL